MGSEVWDGARKLGVRANLQQKCMQGVGKLLATHRYPQCRRLGMRCGFPSENERDRR